jgi:hypothetical protein
MVRALSVSPVILSAAIFSPREEIPESKDP